MGNEPTNGDIQALAADPDSIIALFARSRSWFQDRLGEPFSDLSDTGIRLAFSSYVASRAKPYGASRGTDFRELLRGPTLKCDSYCIVTMGLLNLLLPTDHPRVTFVGWDGGAVGNHVQIFAQERLFLDPTIGLLARGSFDGVASGKPLPEGHCISLFAGGPLSGFNDNVLGAIKAGSYRPSHLLYFFDKLSDFLTEYEHRHHWATPQAARLFPKECGLQGM